MLTLIGLLEALAILAEFDHENAGGSATERDGQHGCATGTYRQ